MMITDKSRLTDLKISFIIISLLVFSWSITNAQTIGLTLNNPAATPNGYILFTPMTSTNTFLVDKCGKLVKTWPSTYRPGLSCYLMNDGTLLRTGSTNNPNYNAGGRGGVIQKIDWNGNVTWSYTISDSLKCQHHDVKELPNGNVLVIAWEVKTSAVAIANGRNPALVTPKVWSEQILEIQPVGSTGGNIVWQWNLWNHLVQEFDSTKANYASVESNPQLVNINYNASSTTADWIHLNSVDYNPALDQIVLSAHAFDEIWIIDHSTTTAQAAGHTGGNAGKGGDILYRWGNPATYNAAGAQQFFGQHNAHWIKPGLPYENQIMVFNNGSGRVGGNYSTIEIINPPLNGYNYISTLPYLPANPSWIYNAGNPNNFYAQNISGAQLLSSGNVIYTQGPSGIFTEIDSSGNKLWNYVNPVNSLGAMTQGVVPSTNSVFRCNYYPENFSGFAGHTLIADTTIEHSNVLSDSCSLTTSILVNNQATALNLYPNPASDIIRLQFTNSLNEKGDIIIYDICGRVVKQLQIDFNNTSVDVDIKNLNQGDYYLKLNGSTYSYAKQFIVIR